METNSSEDTVTEPMDVDNFRIREYVAEVRRKDWKKCCPFNLSRYSQEYDAQAAERVFASLVLKDNDALVNSPTYTETSNSLTLSIVRNPEVQPAISETHTGAVSGNDATNMVDAENDKPEEAAVDDHSLKDDVEYQNAINVISEDTEAASDDKYTTSDEERNLAGERPKKFRLLSNILKELAGPCDAASAAAGCCIDSEFSSESEDDSSDNFTLDTSLKKEKGVRVSFKRRVVSKKKKKSHKVREHRAKRMKHVSEESSGKNLEVRSKRPLRKTRTYNKVNLQVINKNKESSTEIIMHDNTSGIQRAELVQSTTGILKNTKETFGCVEKSVRENSPVIDNESMAALQLIRLSKSWETTTHTSSKSTATEDPTLFIPKSDEILCGRDGKMASASASIVGQSREELNMINGAGLPQPKKHESEEPNCVMNMNPSEFSIPNAKKYMRSVKVIQK